MNTMQSSVVCKRVRINDWSSARLVCISPAEVSLQVTSSGGCGSRCDTCQRRVKEFQWTLGMKPKVKHKWVFEVGVHWLVFPKKKDKDPLEYLKEILNLSRICYCE